VNNPFPFFTSPQQITSSVIHQMNNFNRCCSAEEHDGRSEVSLQLVLGDELSMPMFFRAIRGALCHVLTGFFLANSSEGQKVDSSCGM